MPYPECKVYYDGSSYIAIPHTTRPYKPRRKVKEEKITVKPYTMSEEKASESSQVEVKSTVEPQSELTPLEQIAQEEFLIWDESPSSEASGILNEEGDVRVMTKRELFDEVYKENVYKKKRERKEILLKAMRPYFNSDEATKNYVKSNLERKKRNVIVRRVRLTRKANLQTFNYFVTFTYDGAKHTEESFKKQLKTCLTHLCSRKGWKYIGVWERSPEKKRLHFHGIFHIPEGTMPGILYEQKDYNFKSHRRETTVQNTYFVEKFGRCDFERIVDRYRVGSALAYLMKYIEKSEERIVYSKGLPQFFITDIMDNDVLCPFGLEDKKLLLFDDFACWNEGEYIGTVSKETIAQLRQCS